MLIKYIKSVLWRVAKCLSYIEEARCLKVKQDLKSVDNQQNYSLGNSSDPKNMQESTQHVQTLPEGMQDKFQTMSDQIITRIDEMGNRIDDLEKNIADLMTQAGVEGADIKGA